VQSQTGKLQRSAAPSIPPSDARWPTLITSMVSISMGFSGPTIGIESHDRQSHEAANIATDQVFAEDNSSVNVHRTLTKNSLSIKSRIFSDLTSWLKSTALSLGEWSGQSCRRCGGHECRQDESAIKGR